MATVSAKPLLATTSLLMLQVSDAANFSAISEYKYLINVDNTGDPVQPREAGCSPEDPGYPDSCNWPSIRAVPGAAPIYTQGTQDDFNGTIFNGLVLPDGKYLVSVMANGYKLGGVHFSVPLESPGIVSIALEPHPLPAATMRIKVFEDDASVNGQYDTDEHGLEGFRAIVNDILGQVTTDIFGNPLCTSYDASGNPTGLNEYGCLISDANGDIVIPNLGPNRYDVAVNPPTGTLWTETTTLEGSPSWDTWLQEGGSGLDNEFVVAGEPFPWTMFGFVQPENSLPAGAAGGISGTLVSASVYLPQSGALPYFGDIWNGFSGTKVTGAISDGWVALSDLQNGDQAVYVGQAGADGAFAITGVPDGNYLFTWWDQRLHYIMDWMQVTVSDGQMTDIGTPMLTGWFTRVEGYVFNDANSNGIKDAGEAGIPDYLVVLKDRDNSEIDRMSISALTDASGYYAFEKAYPMGSWMILEAYSDRYYTTGVTYQVENQPTATTVLGAGVDVGILPILGQSGRLDWGVHAYARGTNGGIVGTVFYDTTRNELDPRYQAVEGWAPGIPGLLVTLSRPVPCGVTPGADCDPTGMYELAADGSIARVADAGGVACGTTPGAACDPTGAWELDGAGNYAVGPVVSTAITETWEQPVDCTARDANGDILTYPDDQALLPPDGSGKRCIEAPLMGTQFQNGFATLDGNYGFDTVYSGFGGSAEPVGNAIPAGDYLVEVVVPQDDLGRDLYTVVREEDINIFGGDEFVPAVPPPACAGPSHQVDVLGVGADGPGAVDNPPFADAGGSVYEGQARPLCGTKLVTLSNGKSVAPAFTFFTEVPIPGRWKGYIIDDLTVSTNPIDLNFGEKAGVPLAPIGIYDFNNHRVASMVSDPNGVFEILLPSTYSINCPSPSGVCPNVYYMLGNDPNLSGFNPQYRTIGASFEIYPGLWIPSDLAPTQIVPGVLAAGSLFSQPPQCALDAATPQIYTVNTPYGPAGSSLVITGLGFGATKGAGQVTLDDLTLVNTTQWNDTNIVATIPAVSPGPHQLKVTAANGASTVNGLTFHVIGSGYNPAIFEVGPGKPYATIQDAVNAASAAPAAAGRLVVVYPSDSGFYLENVVIHEAIKLQGVGPGGSYPGNVVVQGSVIDGRGLTGDTDYATNWRNFVLGLNWSGNQAVYEGAVIYVLAQDGDFTGGSLAAAIDGFTIQGGDQQGFPNVLNPVDPTVKDIASIQGGGIFVNGYARNLRITNNILQSNGGAYGGAIRLGTPHLPGALNDNQNDNVRIANNRILANGSANLAGAIGIFSGADGYAVSSNDICGNFSAEYGGGISHYGYSPNGVIDHNRIYFNRSYDEGGGIMVAGELPADPNTLTQGAGAVNIFANLVQNNLANDDGGGLRFLMAGNFAYDVYNNIFANNISTHEGGGVSLNDAPGVRFYNNTVMKNITTATAMTSNGQPAPAGLATSRNSNLLQASLPSGAPLFSDPLLFNNIFWDNRAGTFVGSTIAGIGLAGDPNPINLWDLGVADGTGLLAPTNSILQVDLGTVVDASNLSVDPQVVSTYDTSVRALPWRGNPRFVDVLMITADATPNLLGNYHLAAGSPAIDAGAVSKAGVNAPDQDFDRGARPSNGGFEIGADETPALATADLRVTKTDRISAVSAGGIITYTIVVSNAGPQAASNAGVEDNLPAGIASATWTCAATGGSSCGVASGTGSINSSVSLASGGSATYVVTATVSSTASGTLANTVTVSAPGGVVDPNPANNSATDSDSILAAAPLPALPLRDNFNRANANTLGSNWSQLALLGNAAIRVNTNRAYAALSGAAYWNGTVGGVSPLYGNRQGAAYTFANAPLNNAAFQPSLVLKATGLAAAIPTNYLRVAYQASTGRVTISTTNGVVNQVARASFAVNFAAGDVISAVALQNGAVRFYKNNTFIGGVIIPTSGADAWTQGAGGGRTGIILPTGQRVDNFRANTVP